MLLTLSVFQALDTWITILRSLKFINLLENLSFNPIWQTLRVRIKLKSPNHIGGAFACLLACRFAQFFHVSCMIRSIRWTNFQSLFWHLKYCHGFSTMDNPLLQLNMGLCWIETKTDLLEQSAKCQPFGKLVWCSRNQREACMCIK
jgi:hypothetical protein